MRILLRAVVLVVAAALWSALTARSFVETGAQDHAARAPADCATITASNSDDCIRLNQIQVLGTHNSYHIAPEPPLLALLGANARDIDYSHRPLAEQLSLGIRKFELDVFADPGGGRYASPAALRMVTGLASIDEAALREPGFKVLHTQDVDYRTTCPTLKRCLAIIRDWSRANPSHVPIMVMIEAKDAALQDPRGLGFVTPIRISAAEFRALDDEIRSVFGAEHIITPDHVRGARHTLAEAVQTDGWPTLRAARGKILLALDNTDAHRDDYLRGNPSLEGRMLFVSSGPGEPSAAFIKMNETLDASQSEGENAIRRQVRRGFLIRTRADIPTTEARNGSTLRRDAAFRSGAQYISTDYPEASPFGSGYIARLPDAERLPARCNPVSAPPGCRNQWLEPSSPRR